ncbi:MAG TPA: UDP-N-acetylmuramoyl-tripeptide--D-alanyl-D-alanine ligase, partial [Bryobacteraceae bacterium]
MPSTPVSGWSIDTRTLNAGDLFFAIHGETQNGHDYVKTAFEHGAIAAVVSEPVDAPGMLIHVEDTLAGLQNLGMWARRRWGKPIVAVTGSAGKTTTKDIIAELLAVRFAVGKTAGNLNNHIGLPLSLLRIPDTAEIGVMELGMNHSGEIRFLASLAHPQVAVVTNIGYAHIENFADIEGIALAKRELVEGLGSEGTAILNADDARVAGFRSVHEGRVLTYGFSDDADVKAEEVHLDSNGSEFRVRETRFRSSLRGRHGVSNLLAGIATARAFEIPEQDLVAAVERIRPGAMRGERRQWNGITILNDSYNSNPEAATSMIDVLRAEPARRRIAVLGEMLELGR